jgi:Fic family protein
MCDLVNSKNNVFEKALLALVLISYIQPFFDGNKRTARIVSNAILMNNKHCPIFKKWIGFEGVEEDGGAGWDRLKT